MSKATTDETWLVGQLVAERDALRAQVAELKAQAVQKRLSLEDAQQADLMEHGTVADATNFHADRELTRRTQELRALFEASKIVLAADAFTDAAQKILDAAKNLIGAQAGSVTLRTDKEGESETLCLESRESSGRERSVAFCLPTPLRALCAEAYRTGHAVFSNDLSTARLAELLPPGHLELHNVLFAPLRIEGKVVGVLGLANKPGGFSEPDATAAEAFGDLAAIALRHSKNQRALRESEARYRQLFENINTGVAVYEVIGDAEDFILRDFNRAGEKMSSVQRETLMGRSIFEVRRGIERSALIEAFRQVWKTGNSISIPATTYEDERLSGWYENFIYKLSSGEIVSVFENVTDRMQAQEERDELQIQLFQAQKMEAVGQLAGGIAHDFNNILGAIVLQLNMLQLQRNVPPEELSQALAELLKSTKRAARLTEQLLLFSRRQEMVTARYDVNDIVRDLSKLLRRMIDERVAIHLELCEEPQWIDGDAGMIEQVVTNLCVNARDAMPQGGQLTIRSSRRGPSDDLASWHPNCVRGGSYVCLEVSDTGCGIDAEALTHIFEPFFTTKPQGRGTGLGLATVHGIVAKHGGFVEVQSVVGLGSTFQVFLPRAVSGPPVKETAPPVAAHGGAESILVVEDEAFLRHMVVRCLRNLGYRVTEAIHGVDALDVWRQEKGSFDLLLTDMIMPEGISGLDLFLCLRQDKASLKAIIASGYTVELNDDVNAALQEVKFLPKPYDVETLTAAVRDCLQAT